LLIESFLAYNEISNFHVFAHGAALAEPKIRSGFYDTGAVVGWSRSGAYKASVMYHEVWIPLSCDEISISFSWFFGYTMFVSPHISGTSPIVPWENESKS
jgi:hypothetical protein